ncbi:MAG: hypothetical protein E6G90_06875 [Alphaproteobacteria bacterium]|nr:MAG: hypothetical protein E6G90_06875 [Alphaproteobacteria bacterium]
MLALVAGTTLTLRFAAAAAVAKLGNSSAERGQHTMPMITANSTRVTASHTISPTGFSPIALTVGEALMPMIDPSRGSFPTGNADGRTWLPRPAAPAAVAKSGHS